MQKAKPKNYDEEQLAAARRWLHGYMCKFGREPKAHAPDDAIAAQFLAVAPWPELEALLYDLMAEKQEPGYQARKRR